MHKTNAENILQDLNEQQKELKEVLMNYTSAYNRLIEKLSKVEETDETKEVKRKALDNLISIEEQYESLKELIDRTSKTKE